MLRVTSFSGRSMQRARTLPMRVRYLATSNSNKTPTRPEDFTEVLKRTYGASTHGKSSDIKNKEKYAVKRSRRDPLGKALAWQGTDTTILVGSPHLQFLIPDDVLLPKSLDRFGKFVFKLCIPLSKTRDMLPSIKSPPSSFKIRHPICITSTGRPTTAKLDLSNALKDSKTSESLVESKDYRQLVFIPQEDLKAYKEEFPTQPFVCVPVKSGASKTILKEAAKAFCSLFDYEYFYLMEDNVHCAVGPDGEAMSLLDAINNTQEAATDTDAIIGARKFSGLFEASEEPSFDLCKGLSLINVEATRPLAFAEKDANDSAWLGDFQQNLGIVDTKLQYNAWKKDLPVKRVNTHAIHFGFLSK
mmetsp:Transcript_16255/g.18084  ORF Transcript_16255/g.18084 Transcript_16255/m.18084 type:complete len:359 (+) Transcript_16255:49-1125(+)